MNVALCSEGDLYGGKEKLVLTLAAHLETMPLHHVQAVLFTKGALYKKLLEKGIETELFERPRYDLTVIRRLAQFFRERRVDVVHTHGYKANILCGGAARLAGIRVVKTEHGALEPFEGLDRIKMSVNASLDRWVSRRLVNRIVYVSKDIQQQHAAYYDGVPGEVIYNGIPPAPFELDGAPPPFDPSTFNLGIVGRLSAVKGHVYLLEALKDLDRLRIRLHVLGDGELRRPLERLVEASGLAGRVSFLGFRSNVDVYLRAFDAVAMPSLHEGFPYTMLEAAYWGVPLVASRVGGIQEVLDDNRECLLVEPRRADQLSFAIARLYNDAALRKTIGRNARRKVLERFLIDRMAIEYVSAYERSLNGHAA